MTEVLAVASEAYPLIKTGGLADVTGALPAALKPHGINVRTLIPAYPAVLAKLGATSEVASVAYLHGGGARLLACRVRDLDLLVLDAPHLFDRSGGPYTDATGADWPDNWRRFAALGSIAAELARGLVPG
ncbi:MAG: glycogen/starch synthase, partial [Cucumibacter sp.]